MRNPDCYADERTPIERRQDEIDASLEQDLWDAIRKGEEPREWEGAEFFGYED